jgi:predicted AAA+ superfamily ATPase
LSDTINKDVKARHKIKKSESLDKLTKFVFSNIGHIISANKIEKYLKSSKETKLTGKTIIKQLE